VRCAVCTQDDTWQAYDVFSRLGAKEVHGLGSEPELSRQAFLEGLRLEPTLCQLKVLRRSKLAERFRASAAPVVLKEFFALLWPRAAPADLEQMHRWTQLRKAQGVILDADFRGTDEELRLIFGYLDEDQSGGLCMLELQRARILDPKEMDEIMDEFDVDGDGKIDFQEFCAMVRPALKAKVSATTRRKLEEEQKQQLSEDMKLAFGSRPR